MIIYKFERFTSRSQRLAINIMKTLELKDSIIDQFKTNGKVTKTDCRNPIRSYQKELSNEDERIIAQLKEDGLLVYHIILSSFMVNKKTIIESDIDITTFDSITDIKYFLYVPSDLADELRSIMFLEGRDEVEVIKTYIDDVLSSVEEGSIWGLIFVPKSQRDHFGNFNISVFNGNPIVNQ